MSDRFEFTLGSIDIAVRSDLPEVVDDLAALYRGCETAVTDRSNAISMEVRKTSRLPSVRRRYAVFGDGEAFGTDIRRREVLPYLEWGVNWRVVARSTNRLLVHAASMARDGRGVVFAGGSGAGKSTLVAGLVARGWQYLCDEFAMIDASTLELVPFPKAVCVKAGSFDLVRKLNLRLCGDRRYVKALKGEVGYISPSELPAAAATEPCPVRYVVFPRYTGHREPRVRPVTDARAAFMLTSHTLNRGELGERAASAATRIARDAQCLLLESGEIGAACDLIEAVVGPS